MTSWGHPSIPHVTPFLKKSFILYPHPSKMLTLVKTLYNKECDDDETGFELDVSRHWEIFPITQWQTCMNSMSGISSSLSDSTTHVMTLQPFLPYNKMTNKTLRASRWPGLHFPPKTSHKEPNASSNLNNNINWILKGSLSHHPISIEYWKDQLVTTQFV